MTTASYASATPEDLQVAEDALREQGRHAEADRLMAFREAEPLLRRLAAARDARELARRERPEMDAEKDHDVVMETLNAEVVLHDLASRLYGLVRPNTYERRDPSPMWSDDEQAGHREANFTTAEYQAF